jgi:hypothetical protein
MIGWFRGWRQQPAKLATPTPTHSHHEVPPARTGWHYHFCLNASCKTYVVCDRGPDCTVGPEECRACEQDRMMVWLDENEEARNRRA